MDYFQYRDGELFCEDVPARRLASEFGTPLFVYSRRTITEHLEKIIAAFAPARPHISYSVKANSNLAILRLVKESGVAFDAVSGGEIYRILRCGGQGKDIVFAGVGKSRQEIAMALEVGILMFNVESRGELERIEGEAARLGTRAPVALRLNPDVDPKTHRYITTGKRENKFGLDIATAGEIASSMDDFPHTDLVGLHMHIGSQITSVQPYVRALEKILAFARKIVEQGVSLEWINIGGGFGITYTDDDKARPIEEYAQAILPLLTGTGFRIILEPGRFVVGNGGVLLSQVEYVKTSQDRRFVIVDAAMNDLIRPSLYEAFHRIGGVLATKAGEATLPADVVGPICESGDFLGRNLPLPAVEPGDLLAVFSTGAYGFSMASNYNSRPRAAEVLVHGDSYSLVRRRETWQDLVAPEEGLA
jgi:diaminopimelate decarboxylase